MSHPFEAPTSNLRTIVCRRPASTSWAFHWRQRPTPWWSWFSSPEITDASAGAIFGFSVLGFISKVVASPCLTDMLS